MKISLSQNQWFDGQGYPLVSGRISVYLHGSDTLAEIYTLEGENYVRAANPVILDNDGRSDTLWSTARHPLTWLATSGCAFSRPFVPASP